MLPDPAAADGVQKLGANQAICAWLLDHHLVVGEFPQPTLHLYSPSAAALWLQLLSPVTAAELIATTAALYALAPATLAADVSRTLHHWSALGWLECDGTHYQVSRRPPAPLPATAPALPHPEVWQTRCLHTHFGERPLQLQLAMTADADPACFARLCAIGAGLGQFAPASGTRPDLRATLTTSGMLLGTDAQTTCHRDELVGPLLFELLRQANPSAPRPASLHAAALAHGRHGLLLPGHSGAGKSTLAVALNARGWDYLGDDLIGLANDGRILALPTAASLKAGSWSLFPQHADTLADLPVHHYADKQAKYLPLPCHRPSAQLAAWIFPQYVAGSPLQPVALSPGDTLQALIAGGMGIAPDATEAEIDALLQQLHRHPAYRIQYSDLAALDHWLQQCLPH